MIDKHGIVELINCFIDNKEKKAVDINIYDNFFSLKIYGDIPSGEDMDSILINSLCSLCEEVYYINIADKVKTTYNINFSDPEKKMYKIRQVSVLSCKDNTDSAAFIFYKNYYKSPLKSLENIDNRNSFKKYINKVYNNAFSYLKIRCFNEILSFKDREGTLLNKDCSLVSHNLKIEVYKMDSYYKDVDIIVKGIKADDIISHKYINWNKYPFRQKGYSFKSLCAVIYIMDDSINVKDNKAIEEFLIKNESYLTAMIERYKNEFRKDKVYYTLGYDKNKMQAIIDKTEKRSVLEAVNFVLDKFYDSL